MIPQTLTQIAFGIGDIDTNPELWQMMRYCRDHMIIPNLTINGERMTPQYYDLIASNCGACAVSLYDKETCYNTVKELTDRRMTQVNIHCLLSEETFQKCKDVLHDRLKDPRLANLNAVVFLWLKPKGDRNNLNKLSSMDKFKELLKYSFDNDIKIGFDSCTSPMFLEAIDGTPHYDEMYKCVDPCESTLFSYYINVDGIGHPCSFSETLGKGVDLTKTNNFLKDVWNHHSTLGFRKQLEKGKDKRGCRTCPIYNLTPQMTSF
jgi:radical SAM protein with 4Fe4S-binding SPASM domain